MDLTLVATAFRLAVTYGPIIQGIWNVATSNEDVVTRIRHAAAPVAQLIEEVGGQFYPGAKSELHMIGGLITSFDPDGAKWLQGSLNAYLGTSLVVDGNIGPRTIAAVKEAQAKLGIVVDGLAGKVTQAALDSAIQLLAAKKG